MTVTKILARDHGNSWEINTGTTLSPTWTPIKSISSWTHNPSKTDVDTTDFDDDGRTSHLVASRGTEFTLTGSYLEDPDNGNRDAGQAAVEALGAKYGHDSLGEFRYTSPGGNRVAFVGSANVTVGGGGNDDKSTWEATITVSGALTKTTV